MTLNISLSSRAEAILRDRAAAVGKEPTVLASELLEEAVSKSAENSTPPLDDAASVAESLTPILQEIWSIEPDPLPSDLKGQEAVIRGMVVEKFRKQGLKL